MAPTTDDRVCGKAQTTVLPGRPQVALLCSRPTVRGRGGGSSAFAGPHRSTRHLSPATGRGSSLAEVFRDAEKEERGQNPGEVAEVSSEGERAKQAATPACPADAGQLRRKAV